MKAEDIKEYEEGAHCYGPILTINGKDYKDYTNEELIEFLNDMFENDLNAGLLLRECVQKGLDFLQADLVESSSSSCDQCGNYNHYNKFKI